MPSSHSKPTGEVDRLAVIECDGVRVTFDSHGFPTIVGSLRGGPMREHAERGGKSVEFVPADQLRGAVAAISTLRAAIGEMQGHSGADPIWLESIGQQALDATAEWGR